MNNFNFLRANDLAISSEQLLGKNNTGVLISCKPYFEYVNDKKTDNVLGYRYLIKCTENEDKLISVKVLGNCQIAADASVAEVHVKLEGLAVKFYTDSDNRVALSISAESIKEV